MDDHTREPYPRWIMLGMDGLAAGMLLASFRDAWAVVKGLGQDTDSLANSIVAGAVVLAIDAAILLLEQARSQVKMRGGNLRVCDTWVLVLIALSAVLNVRYLTAVGTVADRIIASALGVAIPSTIAVLGYIKGDMLAHNARSRRAAATATAPFGAFPRPVPQRPLPQAASPFPAVAPSADETPLFRLKRA